MIDNKKTLLESYLVGEWEVITEEQKKEFREKSMERIGDVIEKYLQICKRGFRHGRGFISNYYFN